MGKPARTILQIMPAPAGYFVVYGDPEDEILFTRPVAVLALVDDVNHFTQPTREVVPLVANRDTGTFIEPDSDNYLGLASPDINIEEVFAKDLRLYLERVRIEHGQPEGGKS